MVDPAALERARAALIGDPGPIDAERLCRALQDAGVGWDGHAAWLAGTALARELDGTGLLEELIGEPEVTDVVVNGPERIWVDRGRGLERAPVRFESEEALRRLAVRLVAAAGTRLDDAQPYADVGLDGGVRLHAVLPPVGAGGPYLSLRVPARRRRSLADLAAGGGLDARTHELLRQVVAARLTTVVTGATGAGKTTLLSALLECAPGGERLVIIEDTPELTPRHPHVVHLHARAANLEGVGRIGIADLVRECLRMRPDRIVVGEVRGPELVTLLAALTVGHDGSMSTLHAGSAADVPRRLASLAFLAGTAPAGLAVAVAASIRVVVHLGRDRAHPGAPRFVAEVALLERRRGRVRVVPALRRPGLEFPAQPGPAARTLQALLDARTR